MKRPFDEVLLAHGAGGRLTRELIEEVFLPALDNPHLATLSDSAVLSELPAGRPAFTTDGFVVDPPRFPGGDIGYLSICGTVNDLAMAGARPLWLSWALILEEGAASGLVRACVEGAARGAREAGVTVVAGDTKVVPRGKADRLFVTTAGLGVVPPGRDLGDHQICPGDAIVVSGPIGDHGATVLASRHQLDAPDLCSDCAPLSTLVESLFDAGIPVHSLHDPTRGGVLGVCHEVASRRGVGLRLDEDALPIRPQVQAVCDLLGLEVLNLACEGRLLAWLPMDQAQAAVRVLRAHRRGAGAAIIGRVEEDPPGGTPVILETRVGGIRPLDHLSGTDLPRIC